MSYGHRTLKNLQSIIAPYMDAKSCTDMSGFFMLHESLEPGIAQCGLHAELAY